LPHDLSSVLKPSSKPASKARPRAVSTSTSKLPAVSVSAEKPLSRPRRTSRTLRQSGSSATVIPVVALPPTPADIPLPSSRPHRHYRPAYTRANGSIARPSARSTSRRGRLTCLPPVRTPRSARGAGRCAGSQPSYRTRMRTWMLMPMSTMRTRRHYPRRALSAPFPHRRRRRRLLPGRPPHRDD